MTKIPSDVSRELNVRADMTITKDDLVAIRIAEVERALYDQRMAVIERRRAADAALKRAEVELSEVKSSVAYAAVGDRFDNAVVALDRIVISKDRFDTCAVIRVDPKTKRRMAVGWIGGISNTEFEKDLTADQNSRVQAAEDAVTTQHAEIKACEEAMLDIKRKIADLPMLERQAKAAVATAVMGAGDGATLLGIVSKVTLPGLPAPKA